MFLLLASILVAEAVAAQTTVPPPSPAPSFPPHVGGQWGPVIEWPHVPVSMAHLPDGRILTFSANEPNDWPSSTTDEYTHAGVWDPATGVLRSIPHPNHDMFCAAFVTLESGEPMVMGGLNGALSPWVSRFDFQADRWIQSPTSADMNRGRWYPTAVHMGFGGVFIAVGIGGGQYPELWTPTAGWKLLSGIDLTQPILDFGYIEGAGVWPLLLLHPDGTIFHHGATQTMHSIDPLGGPAGLGTITPLADHGFDWYPAEGVSVAYEAGKILVAGGWSHVDRAQSSNHARRIDLNGPAPVISPASPMIFPRTFMNEVVLPTGEVLVVGGSTRRYKFEDAYAIRNAEVWDPESDAWQLLNAQDQARTYHSTALLLPDGSVLSAGGGLTGQPCTGTGAPGECNGDHWNGEVFRPPYLFAADDAAAVRPVIERAPRVARVGRTIRVHATEGLDGFSLIRMSATTHTMNTDQRFLRPIVAEVAPGIYDLTLHANENVLVPGHWMLFALAGRVPSVATIVQIVNDGRPRGPRIDGMNHDVGDEVLFQVELADPDGAPLTFGASGLPPGLTLSPTTGIVRGEPTTPGLYNVSIVAFDGEEAVEIDFQWIVSAQRSESGRLDPSADDWTTVELEHAYHRPVVVLGPPGMNEADPSVVRVRNVGRTRFEYRVDEWPYLDRRHAGESIAYLVVEAGEYALADGSTFVAGRTPGVDLQNPQLATFTPGAFDVAPIVVAQVASASVEPTAPPTTARVSAVSTAGFTVALQAQQQSNPSLPAEEVHWIALEPAILPSQLEAARGSQDVDENPLPVEFAHAFSTSPLLFAALQSSLDGDPATLRWQDASAAGFTLFAQEETSGDPETDHLPEAFGWLAIEPGATSLALRPLWNEPPLLATPLPQTATREVGFSLFLDAVDPEGGPLTFSATGLPPGLAVDPDTGEIAGTPLALGEFIVQAAVTDESGALASASFPLTIVEPLRLLAFPTPPQLRGALARYEAQTGASGSFLYSWDFGDGSLPVSAQTASTVEHVFSEPGRRIVTLSVVDPETGRSDVLQFVQIVVAPPTASAPTSSSSIVHEETHDRVFSVEPDSASVAVFDVATRQRIAEIAVASGPATLAVSGDGDVWVACKDGDAIQRIDPDTLAVSQTIALPSGSSPHGLVFDPAGGAVFVVLEAAGTVLRLDAATGAVVASRAIGRHARHVSVDADGGNVYVSRFVTPPLPGEASGQPQGEPGGEPIGGEVLRLDPATLSILGRIVLPPSDRPDGSQSARGVPNYLGAVALSPDGGQGLVPSKQDNLMRGGFRDGQPLGHDTLVRAITSPIDLTTGLAPVASRIDHDNASVANATIWSAEGAYAFSALEGNRQLAILDPQSGLELGRVETGRAPRGLALSPDGRTLFVDEFMDRSIALFDLSPLLDHDDTNLPLLGRIAKREVDALPPEVLLGKQHFYDAADPRLSRERYVYCAACHNEGGSDGRVWDFTQQGEGLRNTIDLRGRGAGHGPLHWTASFDEVHDFEGQIRAFGGDGLMADVEFAATADPLGAPKAGRSPDLDALAAYVGSLVSTGPSPARAADGTLTPEAQLGRLVFVEKACGACHRGAPFTDSARIRTHDVGTARPSSGPHTAFDTPTLRGLWRTAPYLHDGSALTLADAVTAHSDGPIAAEDLSNLVAYLEQIDDAVVAAPNDPPTLTITSPLPGSATSEGRSIDLVASADDREDGDLSAAIAWASDLDGALGTGGRVVVASLSVGLHRIGATVTDGEGLSVLSTFTLEVAADRPPMVAVVSPAPASTVTEGTPVDLVATASDAEDGDLSPSVRWTSSRDGSVAGGPTTSLSNGVHVLTAFVVDSVGNIDSATTLLRIVANSPPVVAITSPAATLTTTSGENVRFEATAIDAEDGDLSARIDWASSLDGPLGVGGVLDVADLTAGLHTVTATVRDGQGRVATDQRAVEVPEPGSVELLGAGLLALSLFAQRRARRASAAARTSRVVDATCRM